MSETVNRSLIPFTGEHFAAFCLKMVGQPYWFGTCIYKCTNNLLTRKTEQYPSSYGSSRINQYKRDIAAKKIAADCIGGAKGYAWTGGGQGVLESIGTDKTYASVYGGNGCPDKGADSMFTYAKQKGSAWGAIATLPEILGLAVHKSGHVGYYVGNGEVVEWKGFSYGCVKSKLSATKWTHWYQLPFIQYGDALPTPPANPAEEGTGIRTLQYRSGQSMLRGEDVRLVQEMLSAHGFDPGKIDSIFGVKTESAVKAFQANNGLEVDGIVGSKTREALEAPPQVPAPEKEAAQEPEDQPHQGASPDYGTRLLKYQGGRRYMTGDDVANVQRRLFALRYDPGKVDGKYGPNTEAAVKHLQTTAGIKVDGIVGPDTRAQLAK